MAPAVFSRSLLAAMLLFATPASLHAQTAQDLYSKGVEARQAGEFKKAADFLVRALSLEPDSADALVQLGFSRLAIDDRSGAQYAFDKALDIAPDYQDARFGLAQIAFRSGEIEKADTLLADVLAAQPDNADARDLAGSISRARAGVIVEKPLQSSTVKTVVKPAPRKPRVVPLAARLRRAGNKRIAGDLSGAEDDYRGVLAQDSDNTDAMVGLGLVLSANGNVDEAEALFARTLQIVPDYTDARAGLLRLALSKDDVKGARTIIENLTLNERSNTDIKILTGRLLMREHRYREARDIYQAVLDKQPSHQDALIGLSDAEQALGRYAAAREALETAQALDPASEVLAARLLVVDQPKWRLDVASEYSSLSDGRRSWTDTNSTISYRLRPDTTMSFSARVATRGEPEDVQLGLRFDHSFNEFITAGASVAVTPDADFLPDATLTGSIRFAVPTEGAVSPFFDLGLKHDIYASATVTTVTPGAGIELNDMARFYARWIHSENDSGTESAGYLVRVDISPFDRFGLFAGYSDAPEIEDAALVETKTWFAGASFDFTDTALFRINYARETRPTFDRDSFGIGLSYRF